MRAKFLISTVLISTALIESALSAAPQGKTVWEGVYTPAQAARGEEIFSAECSRCHNDAPGGSRGPLSGPAFMTEWREDRLVNLFNLIKKTMPRSAPASLTDQAYLDIVAYLLQVNAFPAGEQELTADKLGSVLIQERQGPQPVPDSALVGVVGCLTQGAAGAWIVTRSSEPVRTRNPDASSAAELKALETKPLGSQTFQLLEDAPLPAHPPKDQKVEVKGFLIRQAGGNRINATSVQAVASSCTADP